MNKRIIVATLIFLLPLNFVSAQTAGQTKAESKNEANFCAQINNTSDKITKGMNDFSVKLSEGHKQNKDKNNQLRNQEDLQTSQKNIQEDKQFGDKIKALENQITDSQKQAIAQFQQTLKGAISARRSATEKAKNDFRDQVDQVLSSGQQSITAAFDVYRSTNNQVLQKAKTDCSNGVNSSTVRQEYTAGLKNSLDTLKNTFSQLKISDEINKLKDAEIAAIKQANDTFKQTVQRAVETLKQALLSGGNGTGGTGGSASDLVASISLVTSDGGRLDWSTTNNLVAFDRRKSNNYYALYIASPDLSNPTCLTCNFSQFEKRHAGNPVWTPDGNYIVFQAQSNDKAPDLDTPGKGLNNDLYIITKDGSQYWPLTDLSSQKYYGILHPKVSQDGKKLLWVQLVSSGNIFGIWQLKVADLGFNGGVPQLANIKTYTPGTKPGLYESHGFSPDSKYIYFSSNAFNQQPSGFDIYRMELATGKVLNYNNSTKDWDEHAQLSPDGAKIVWSSSAGQKNASNDLWIMNSSDGNGKTKLTDFHNSASPIYVGSGGFGPADASWSADGKQLLMYVINDQQGTGGKIYLMKFK